MFGVCRATIGDGVVYELDFYKIKASNDIFNVDDHLESGYILLNKFMPTFGSLEVLIVCVVCLALALLFYRYVKPQYSWLAVVMLFICGNNTIFFLYGTYRNALAACVFYFSLLFLYRKQYIYYIIMAFIATRFHTSLWFSMALPLLISFTWSLPKVPQNIIWITVPIGFIMSSQSGLIDLIAPYINEHFERYNSVVNAFSGRDLGMLNILGSLVILYGLYYIVNHSKQDSYTLFIYRLSMLYPLASLLGALNARMSQVYAPFFIMAIALLLGEKGKFKSFFLSFVIVYCIYDFYLWINSEWSVKHLIYHSIWGDFTI
jgi:hypothetical protein